MNRLNDRLTIRLDDELLRKINVLANSTNKNASRIIREALVAYLPLNADQMLTTEDIRQL
jgi:predicted transcriptional regulator